MGCSYVTFWRWRLATGLSTSGGDRRREPFSLYLAALHVACTDLPWHHGSLATYISA